MLLKRDDLGFPSFWPAQALGWGYFYLLLLASNLPSLKMPGELWVISFSVLSMFAASCLLRFPCRAHAARSTLDFSGDACIRVLFAGRRRLGPRA
jgi:hypothetical protein